MTWNDLFGKTLFHEMAKCPIPLDHFRFSGKDTTQIVLAEAAFLGLSRLQKLATEQAANPLTTPSYVFWVAGRLDAIDARIAFEAAAVGALEVHHDLQCALEVHSLSQAHQHVDGVIDESHDNGSSSSEASSEEATSQA